MGLVSAARPAYLAPGDPVTLTGATDAVVIASGTVVLPDGTELRRGTLIGPIGDGPGGVVATARTPTRLWSVPALPGVPLLLGADPAVGRASAAGAGPRIGVHPAAGYPPLAAPPGPPPVIDETVDGRFERRLWWLPPCSCCSRCSSPRTNFIPGPAWAEMPADRALLVDDPGHRRRRPSAGRPVKLTSGDKVYVTEGDQVRLRDRSLGDADLPGRLGHRALRRQRGRRSVRCGARGTGAPCRTASCGWPTGGCWSTPRARGARSGRWSCRSEAAGARLTNDGAAWYRVSAGGGSVVSTGPSGSTTRSSRPPTRRWTAATAVRCRVRPGRPRSRRRARSRPRPTCRRRPRRRASTPTPPAGTDDDDDGTGDDDDNPPPGSRATPGARRSPARRRSRRRPRRPSPTDRTIRR